MSLWRKVEEFVEDNRSDLVPTEHLSFESPIFDQLLWEKYHLTGGPEALFGHIENKYLGRWRDMLNWEQTQSRVAEVKGNLDSNNFTGTVTIRLGKDKHGRKE